MSNLGFHHAMRAAGIDVVTTAVGDRYVLEALRAKELNLGGEQSGHVVFTDAATTGDGLLTALHMMARMAATGSSLAELAGDRAPAAADADQRARSATVPRSPSSGGRGRRGGRGRARTRRRRPDPAAPVGHRAAGAGDGRGRRRSSSADEIAAARRRRRRCRLTFARARRPHSRSTAVGRRAEQARSAPQLGPPA